METRRIHTDRPGELMYHGYVLIDHEDRAILAWNKLPMTISSKVDGWELEAFFRQNPSLDRRDVRARMPRKLTLRSELGTIGMRMSRFRELSASLSWTDREGSKSLQNHLFAYLPAACVQQNSTESFHGKISKADVRAFKQENRGTFPERSRKRKPDEHERSIARARRQAIKNKYRGTCRSSRMSNS